MRKPCLLLATLLFTMLQPLAVNAQQFDYDYIDLRAGYADLDENDGAAFLLGVSHSINEQIFAQAAYQYATAFDEDYWLDDLFLALGFHHSVDSKTDLLATGGLLAEWVEYCYTNCYADDDVGYRLTGGMRHQLQPGLELNVEVELVSIFDDTNSGFILGLQSTPSRGEVSWGGQVKIVEDLTIYSLIARF